MKILINKDHKRIEATKLNGIKRKIIGGLAVAGATLVMFSGCSNSNAIEQPDNSTQNTTSISNNENEEPVTSFREEIKVTDSTATSATSGTSANTREDIIGVIAEKIANKCTRDENGNPSYESDNTISEENLIETGKDITTVLEQAKENSIEKLDTIQAFNHMIPNITAPTWEKNLLNKAMDYLEDIVNEIPVYKLKCTPDIEAVEVLKIYPLLSQ